MILKSSFYVLGLDLESVTTFGAALANHEDIARKCRAFRDLLAIGQQGTSSPEHV